MVRYVSLVNDSVLGQFSKDVVKIDGVGIAVRMSRNLGGLVVDVVPGDAVVRPGRRGNANLRGPEKSFVVRHGKLQ